MSSLVKPEDLLPEPMAPAHPLELLQDDEREVSDEEARQALKEIGAIISVESILAMKTIGTWSAKIKAPKMVMAKSFTSLEEIDLCKQYARTLMKAASGESELDSVADPALMVSGIKMMCLAEQQHQGILKNMMKAQSGLEVPSQKKSGKNAPPALHLHQHITKTEPKT